MKETISIRLHSMDAVKQFVSTITRMSGDFDLICGNHVVDAKSFLGVLSLDLSQCLQLKAMDVAAQDVEHLRELYERGGVM